MTLSIAITSGKGGVGKTNTAVSLAVALGQTGKDILLFDADFGLANTHVLLGTKPSKSVADFLDKKCSMEDSITNFKDGVSILSGGSGLIELLNLDNQRRHQILSGISNLDRNIDYLIVDCPAGAADSTLFFASASDIVAVVLIEEPTSFLDAYALIKAANLEAGVKNFAVIVNMADSKAMAKRSFEKFREIAMRFLDVNLHYAGMVPLSNAIRRSIVKRTPIVSAQPGSPEARAFQAAAKEIVKAPQNEPTGIRFFGN
ncbi:MAG: MinD/ParA family protein [Rhodobacteraceae bacterium]|nr:MinD/ParA family protein [Paracoccaceae bacterium]